jgi:hypothetical protein
MEAPQKILDRLKKLIQKHKGCLEIGQVHEAEAAMLAINCLLTEYNISLEDVYLKNDTAPEVDIVEGNTIRFATGPEFQFSQRLATVIAKYNYCQALFVGLGSSAPAVKIVGLEINVQTCQFLFSFLRRNFTHNADKAAKQHSLEPNARMNFYRDFLAGTIAGIAEKFKAEQTSQTTGIIKWNGEAIERYLAEKNVREHKSRNNRDARSVNAKAYYKGREHGRNVKINKGLESQCNNNSLKQNNV